MHYVTIVPPVSRNRVTSEWNSPVWLTWHLHRHSNDITHPLSLQTFTRTPPHTAHYIQLALRIYSRYSVRMHQCPTASYIISACTQYIRSSAAACPSVGLCMYIDIVWMHVWKVTDTHANTYTVHTYIHNTYLQYLHGMMFTALVAYHTALVHNV